MSPPSTPRVHHPAEAVRRAAADAAAAQVAVEATSGARLDALMQASTAERLSGLDDPALVPADRVRLRRSLQVNLSPSPLARVLPRRRLARIGRGAARLRGPALRLLFLLTALALSAAVALDRRAAPAVLTEATPVTLVRPDGSRIDGTLPAGTPLLVRRLDAARMEAREWRPRQGYLVFTVPASHVRLLR